MRVKFRHMRHGVVSVTVLWAQRARWHVKLLWGAEYFRILNPAVCISLFYARGRYTYFAYLEYSLRVLWPVANLCTTLVYCVSLALSFCYVTRQATNRKIRWEMYTHCSATSDSSAVADNDTTTVVLWEWCITECGWSRMLAGTAEVDTKTFFHGCWCELTS